LTAQELITAGMATNAIVYDHDALPRTFTDRLVLLLMSIAGDSLAPHDPPVSLLVPDWVRMSVPYGCVPAVGGTLWGASVEAIPDDAVEEYRRQGGALPSDKLHLVAVVTRSGKVILGAF